ncbi:GDSL esterase/lipase At5g33370 [Linum perenne]
MGSSPISSQWLAVVLVLALVLGPQVSDAARAFFVFGDSLVDNGNNNYLATTARADSPPYGIDYPTHRATGRFSNGFNIPDLLSQAIGASEPTLPYLSPALNGQRLLVGANFASAGIGILNDTGIQFRGINGECSVELQRAAALFNPQLVDLVNSLNSEIGSNVFIAANAHLINMDFVSNPQAYGFVTSKVACCGQGPYNGLGLCTPASNLCPNRDIYAFWDPFHPSERANRMIVQSILTGDTRVMHPMNLSTVLEMDNSRT